MEPSELEHLILAMVSNGIVSGYAMKKSMEGLRGGRWSAESGSVYRIAKRLAERGWLREAARCGVPNRERTEYAVTEEGNRILVEWLRRPPAREELGFQVESLRTRAYFLENLPCEERLDVVRKWTKEAKAYRAEVALYVSATKLPTATANVALTNLLDMADARLTWLRRLEAHVRCDIDRERAEGRRTIERSTES